MREAAGKQRDAFAEQDRNHAKVELIHQIRFEKLAGEFAAAHVPGIFAGALAEFRDP